MARKTGAGATARAPLSKEAVLRAAIALADKAGLESLSMRRLGQELGVEAMSLYNHTANKDELLDGIADLVVGEIETASEEADWKSAMRRRALSAHEVLLRHPWAPALIESRTNLSPAKTRYCDSVIGTFRKAGFSIELAYHAFLLLDSYIYGFMLQEVSWAFDKQDWPEVVANVRSQIAPAEFPHIAEMTEFALVKAASAGEGEAGYAPEFEFGLDLILDGLERVRSKAARRPSKERPR